MSGILHRIKSDPKSYYKKIISPSWLVWKLHSSYNHYKLVRDSNKVYAYLRELDKNTNQDFARFRSERLKQILVYASAFSNYYRKLFQSLGINPRNLDDFEKIPFLNKKDIRANKDDIVSSRLNTIDYYLQNTGGSTGEPLEFLRSANMSHYGYVHQKWAFEKMGYASGDKIIAFDGSTVSDDRIRNRIFYTEETNSDIPFGRLSFSSLYLTKETIDCYIKQIFQFRPRFFRGYPSFIHDIAVYLLGRGIEVPFELKAIQLTSENVFDYQIENIKKAFGTQVFLQYGHTENAAYGHTLNDAYEYYISPFMGYMEIIKPNGKRAEKGEIGEIIVTSFYNIAMPFIRYATGDLAEVDEEVNGVLKLRRIIGRSQDYIINNHNAKVALTALIFGQHYKAFENIVKWQLIQSTPGKITIRMIRNEKYSLENELEIRGKFERIARVKTEFEYVDSIPLTKAGKFVFLIQHIKN